MYYTFIIVVADVVFLTQSCAPGYVREETASGRYLGRCVPETSKWPLESNVAKC